MPHKFFRPPSFTEEQLARLAQDEKADTAVLAWYLYLRSCCEQFSTFPQVPVDEPRRSRIGIMVVRGLLARLVQLLSSQIVLTQAGPSLSETTSIIDRCTYETAVNITWMCQEAIIDAKHNRFEIFVAHSLLQMKSSHEKIRARAAHQKREQNEAEVNLLGLLPQLMEDAGFDKKKLKSSGKMPRLEERALLAGDNDIEVMHMHEEKSDFVHGGWVSLRIFHLDGPVGATALPRAQPTARDWIEGATVLLFVLKALKFASMYLFDDSDLKNHNFTALHNCEYDVRFLIARWHQNFDSATNK